MFVCPVADILNEIRSKKADSSDSTKALLVDLIHNRKDNIHDHWFPNESKDTLAENS